MPQYFLDTYALIEIAKKNPAYAKFAIVSDSLTSELNLMELYYQVLRDYDAKTARNQHKLLLPIVFKYSRETMQLAMELRLKLKQEKKLNVSYVDAIGYQIAIENNLKFVTGDQAFKDLENVEFVK
ncbi:MAG: PIN domain-containing protein [Candidatus Micrarchaeota archaeon]